MRYVTTVLTAASLSACQTVSSPESSKAEVQQAIQDWASSVNNCNSEKISSLYSPEAVLWGTIAPTIISSPAGIRQYFDQVCSTNPPLKVALGEQRLRVYDNFAVNSGSYTITVFAAGQARQLPARYSFSYQRQGGKWLVVDHHSSLLPTPPAPASAPGR